MTGNLLSATERAASAATFRIAATAMPNIVVPSGLRPFVRRAAEDVAGDLERVFGARPRIVPTLVYNFNHGTHGIHGKLSESNHSRCGASGGLCSSNGAIILSIEGTGWENYALESMPGNVLRISGSDDRGVMFGLYRFASDCLGVDPFRFWSGRDPERVEQRTWEDISIRQGDPSFKFRAWFVNDEDFLNGFRPEENGKREIDYTRYHVCFGPQLADALYETAVRAGFNTVICASYVDILNPDERRLIDAASSRGLYVTTHHQEPVGAGALQLDLHFPEMRGTTYASHPDLWRRAWRRYVGEWAKVPDVIWQLGLRGRKDMPFWVTPDKWCSPDVPETEDRRRAALISSAMAEQLAMIEEALGRRPEHFATQLWIEGTEYYRRGLLKIPDGAIVIFSDNCPGLKFQSDLGGVESLDPAVRFGLYYHLAIVHGNHRCELVPPSRTRQILADAHHKGAREMLLVNVSNIRPFLYTLEAMEEMARNLGGFDAATFRDRWAAARFGDAAAPAVARATELFFASYETVPSRDATSSYGSPRPRAPIAILNDGILCHGIARMVAALLSPLGGEPSAVVSPYDADPDALADVPADLNKRMSQDMHPDLRDPARAGLRARTQSAAFQRCIEQLQRAAAGLGETRRRQLFERFGYPAAFLRLTSDIFAELSAAVEAKALGDADCASRHVRAAVALGRERDVLDARYNSGKWTRWYDRDLVYPCRSVMETLERGFVAATSTTNNPTKETPWTA